MTVPNIPSALAAFPDFSMRCDDRGRQASVISRNPTDSPGLCPGVEQQWMRLHHCLPGRAGGYGMKRAFWGDGSARRRWVDRQSLPSSDPSANARRRAHLDEWTTQRGCK